MEIKYPELIGKHKFNTKERVKTMNKIKRFIQNIRFLLNFNLADEELQVRGLVKDTRNDIQRIEKKTWRTVSRLRDDMERGQSNISKAIRDIEKLKDKD